ncbi:hypothetical protein ACLOJK_003190 [Asimina triloba]
MAWPISLQPCHPFFDFDFSLVYQLSFLHSAKASSNNFLLLREIVGGCRLSSAKVNASAASLLVKFAPLEVEDLDPNLQVGTVNVDPFPLSKLRSNFLQSKASLEEAFFSFSNPTPKSAGPDTSSAAELC